MEYFRTNEVITPDEQHRPMGFAVPAETDQWKIIKRLEDAGLYHGPPHGLGTTLKNGDSVWTVLIEARVGGITPQFVAEKLGASSVLVSKEVVAWPVETYLDIVEASQRPSPTKVLGQSDTVPPDNVWRPVVVAYYEKAMRVDQIVGVLRGAGFDVATASDIGLVQDPQNVFLYVKTNRATPTVAELEKRLGASSLAVNEFPSTADVEFAKEWTAGVNGLEKQIKDLANSLTDLAGSAAGAAKAASDFLGLLGKVAIPVVGGLLALWVYRTAKDIGKKEA